MNDEQTISINDDPATVEMSIREWNGLLDALNRPHQTPNIVAVGYINRLAQQLETQAQQLVKTKQAIETALKNTTCKPMDNPQ
jgi:hypothetical protein